MQGHARSADIFISYSRKDIAFARLLRASLQSSGLDTWIDWDRIPVGARWWEEICGAIECSNVFMFIISDSSVGSSVCRDEINQALKNHKRIIPILVDDLAPETVRAAIPELPELNWVIFAKDRLFQVAEDPQVRSGPPEDRLVALPLPPRFEQAMAKLDAAIHTDWDWVKSHTQLQVDALRWSSKGQDASYLLRGAALEDAEGWLSRAAVHDPQPTLLQSQYLTASRGSETRRQRENSRRQRRLLWVIGGALVVTAAVGAVAVLQRDEAERQATAARSGELAVESRIYLDTSFDIASLLAVESWNTLDSPTSRDALLSALQSRPRLRNVLWTPDELLDITFSPDGGLLAGAYCARTDPISKDCTDHEVGLWSTADGSAAGAPLPGQQGPLAFTTDGAGLITLTAGERQFAAWNLGLRQIQGQVYSGFSAWPGSLQLDSSGTLLAAGGCDEVSLTGGLCSGAQVLVWEVASGRILFQSADAYVADQTSLAFSPDGRTLAWGSCAETGVDAFDNDICLRGKVVTWDTVTGQTVSHPVDGPVVGSIAFSPDGATIAVLAGQVPVLLDTGSWQPTATGDPTGTGLWPSLAFAHDGATLAVVSGGSITLLDGHDARRIDDSDAGSQLGWGDAQSLHPREDTFASSACYQSDHTGFLCQQGVVLMWDIGIRPPPGRAYAPVKNSEGATILSRDGTRQARSSCLRTVRIDARIDRCAEGRIDVIEVATGKPSGPPVLDLPEAPFLVAFDETGERLVTASCFEWDPELIMICRATRIESWDVGTGTRVGPMGVSTDGYLYDLALSPDGGTLILLGSGLERWDLVTGQRASDPIPGWADTSQVEMMAFSPDGTRLAVAGCTLGVNPQDRECQRVEARIWDTATWQAVGEPILLTADLTRAAGMLNEALAFSPDGSQLAIATSEEIRFWDAGSGRMTDASIPVEKPGAIAYAPSGTLLAVGEPQSDGTSKTTLWDLTQMQPLGKSLVDDRDSSSLAFSMDGSTLVSTSGLLWDLDPGAVKDRVCRMVQRSFTAAEWTRFMGTAPYRETCGSPPP